MNRFIIYISALLLITSCGGSKEASQKKELEKLALQVMEVHDRSMPEHGKLYGYKKRLLAVEPTITDSLARLEVSNTIIGIEKADDDMMNWMHNYKAPEDFMPFEEKKAYYIEQKQIIEEVEKRTNNLIDQAQKLIAMHPPQVK